MNLDNIELVSLTPDEYTKLSEYKEKYEEFITDLKNISKDYCVVRVIKRYNHTPFSRMERETEVTLFVGGQIPADKLTDYEDKSIALDKLIESKEDELRELRGDKFKIQDDIRTLEKKLDDIKSESSFLNKIKLLFK